MREPHSRAQSKALLKLIMSKLFAECLEHELAERFSTPTRALAQTAMDIFRNVFDLKVPHSMTIACSQHPRQIVLAKATRRLEPDAIEFLRVDGRTGCPRWSKLCGNIHFWKHFGRTKLRFSGYAEDPNPCCPTNFSPGNCELFE